MKPDLTAHDLLLAVDALVAELLAEASVERPPIDALALARACGVAVVTDRRQAVRARCKTVARQRAIIVRPDDRPERLQWAVAHELGELAAGTILERSGFACDELWPAGREQIANLFASRVLLPTEWFRRDADRLSCDLPSLKTLYATASHELIAWRLLDLDQPAIVSIFDRGQLTRRRGNFHAPSLGLQPAERATQGQAHQSGITASRACAGHGQTPAFQVRAWPIHEPGWKREILYSAYTSHTHEEPGWTEMLQQ